MSITVKLLCLFVAGGLGALSRFGLVSLVDRVVGVQFPWGTFCVNVLGCFLFGLIWAAAVEQGFIAKELMFILLSGYLGAFTTFSSFVFDTNHLLWAGGYFMAALNVFGQVLVGLLGFMGGVLIVNRLWTA